MIELIIAICLAFAAYRLRGRVLLAMLDEGFLWNGVVRLSRGQVPMRDFKSYDPARYVWCWAWMTLFGFSLSGLRRSIAMFQVLGLWAGLSVISTVTDNIAALIVAGVVMTLWMLPGHKIFEHAMSLFILLTVTHLFQSPSSTTALYVGLATGFAGLMGRNHFIYCIAISVVSAALIFPSNCSAELLGMWLIGAIIGYLPMLLAWAIVPGLFQKYLHDKVLVFMRRSLNVNLNTPWPWTLNYSGKLNRNWFSQFFLGLFFMFMPIFYAGTVVWWFVSPESSQGPALAACGIVGIFYFHHALGRSDAQHLCQVIQPFVCGLFVLSLSADTIVWTFLMAATLGVATGVTIQRIDPFLLRLIYPGRFSPVDLKGDAFVAPHQGAKLIQDVEELTNHYQTPGEPVFIAPLEPILYPILGRPTPVYSDFMHFPETVLKQAEIIADLKRNSVNYALINTRATIDKREDLKFRQTHPQVWQHLCDNFSPVETVLEDRGWIYLRRNVTVD